MKIVTITAVLNHHFGESFGFKVNGELRIALPNLKSQKMLFMSALYDASFGETRYEDFYGNGRNEEVVDFDLNVKEYSVEFPNMTQKFIEIV